MRNLIGKGTGAGEDCAKSSGQANAQKIQGQCWNSGQTTSHQSKDCLARPQQQQSQGQSNSLGKGNDVKVKSGKGEGRKGKSKDAGALVWNWQTGSLVASSVASSASQTETSTTVGTIDIATTMAQQEVVNPRWIVFNVDLFFQLISRRKQVVIRHSARTLRVYFAIISVFFWDVFFFLFSFFKKTLSPFYMAAKMIT